jgi:hypothetical protein
MSYRHKPVREGQTVKVNPQVKEHGGKLGVVVSKGQELGWPVVKVKFDDRPRPVTFSPDELERR